MNVGRETLVMAFYPNARGFAHVVFEGPLFPVDWGISDVRRRGRRLDTYVRRLSVLIDRYHPDVLVLRGRSKERELPATQTAIDTIVTLAEGKGVQTYTVSRKEIQRAFAHLGSPTRYAIAGSIAKHIPIFAPLMPPARKIWNGEDRRMGLFDAAALAFTFLSPRAEATASPS
jgi:hypothetical protein